MTIPKTIPVALSKLATDALKYKTYKSWSKAIARKPKKKMPSGGDLSPLNLAGGAVRSHGYLSLKSFWKEANKQ